MTEEGHEAELAKKQAQAAGLQARVEANYQAIQAHAIAIAAAATEAVRRARARRIEALEARVEEEARQQRERAAAEAARQAEEAARAAALAQAERLREIAEGRDERLSALGLLENPPPIGLRAATIVLVIPVLFIADITAVGLTIVVSAALAADPEPVTKLALVIAELALTAAEIYVAFQHVNYAHWLVTGRPIRTMVDLSDWEYRP